MTLYLRTLTVITAFLAAFAGCGKGICLQGSGSITTETRAVEGFTEIHLYNRVNLVLTYDSIESIQVEAGSHLVDGVETSIQNGILTIKDNNTCNWVRDLDNKINVYIHTRQLQRINYYGSGDITSTNTIVADKLFIDSHEGTGSCRMNVLTKECFILVRKNNADITLEGQTNNMHIYCADQGKTDMRNLVCKWAYVDTRSIYDVYINTRESLTAYIRYKGNLYCRGTAWDINVKTYHTGRMITIP